MKAAILIRDASNAHHWSGLPYFLNKSYISKYEKEIVVIETKKFFYFPEFIFKYTFVRLIKIFYKIAGVDISYSFTGSWLYRFLTFLVIFLNKGRINKTDYLFALVAPYGAARWVKVPIVTFTDSSYAYLVRWQKQRELIGLEISVNRKSYRTIQQSTLTVCLFHIVYNELVENGISPNKLLYFPGGLNLPKQMGEDMPTSQQRFSSMTILFVGRKHYIDGAQKLLAAFKFAQMRLPVIKLVIIGLSTNDLNVSEQDNNLTIIPYLDKGNPDDFARYSEIISRVSLFVNVASIAGAFMATIETMAQGIPFILQEYPDIKLFMKDGAESGILVNDIEVEALSDLIVHLFTNFELWERLSSNAQATASKMSWDNLIVEVEKHLFSTANIQV